MSLISDAGTPTISDPGNILIKECIRNEINLIPIPGPSAPTASLSISGFLDKYYFYGFFPESNSEINLNSVPPVPMMLVGLQGSGKTTTTAKLARYL